MLKWQTIEIKISDDQRRRKIRGKLMADKNLEW